MKDKSQRLLDSDEKYKADLYYIAPFYHRHFPSLDQLIALDMTDLRFLDDIGLFHDQFQEMKEEQLIGLFQFFPKMLKNKNEAPLTVSVQVSDQICLLTTI